MSPKTKMISNPNTKLSLLSLLMLPSVALAQTSPFVAADGVAFGSAYGPGNSDPLMQMGGVNNKDLQLDLGAGGAFAIYSDQDALPSFKAGEGHMGVVEAGKWYRIAKSNANNNIRTNAVFNLRDTISLSHTSMTFRTGLMYGVKSKMAFTLLSNSSSTTPVFSEVRYLTKSGWQNEFYLEVKAEKSGNVSYSIMENLSKGGWQPVDWVETTSIPAGYIETKYDTMNKLFMVAGETSILNIDRTTGVAIDGDLTVNGSPVMTAAISPYSINHNGSENALLLGGTYVGGNAAQVPIEGAGTRMMWYPEKAAFRVGRTRGEYWDEAKTGVYSLASGLDNEASGYASNSLGRFNKSQNSFANTLGYNNTATGYASTAIGHTNSVTGNYSSSFGALNTSSGYASTTMGRQNVASNYYAVAMGRNNIASENYTFVHGSTNKATAAHAFVNGYLSEANGVYSFVHGRSSIASGYSSNSFGNDNLAEGDFSSVIGINSRISSYAGMAIGRFNENKHTHVDASTLWQGDNLHSIFEIGIGADDLNRKNALTVMQDGTIELGKDAVTNKVPLKVNSDGSVVLSKAQGDISMGIYGPPAP